jgi:hypothetical protein
MEPQFYFAAISASADGALAVRPPPASVPINADMNASSAELRLVDRSGTGTRVGVARLFSSLMALNPVDRGILAASILDPRAGTQDLGLMDLTKDSTAPLTATRGFAGYPVWSADGKRLAYAYQPPGQLDDVYIKDIRTGLIQPVIETPSITEHPVAWSTTQIAARFHVWRRRRRGDVSVGVVVCGPHTDTLCRAPRCGDAGVFFTQ